MSRSDSTLDDWLGVEDQPDTPDAQEPVSSEQWQPEAPRCRCGAELSEWHAPASARKMVRIYGDDADTVPACPDCVDWGTSDDSQKVDSVPYAIRHMDTEATIERHDRGVIALKEASVDE